MTWGYVAIAAVTAASAIYTNEETRKRQSAADDQVRDEKNRINNEIAWKNKKKGINDQNAAVAALRLRGENGTQGTTVIPGTVGAAPQPGVLGGVGGVTDPNTIAANKLNSPLGL